MINFLFKANKNEINLNQENDIDDDIDSISPIDN